VPKLVTDDNEFHTILQYSESVRSGEHSSVSNQVCTFLSLRSASVAVSDQGIMEYEIVVLSFC
jgi:hypothetical protein